MTIRQKLEVIQKTTGLTQTKLAERLGVSFAAFNGWWTGRSVPREKMQAAIDELFLEVTGQKIIPESQLAAKKQLLQKKSLEHKNAIGEILDSPDIRDQFILKLTYHSGSIEGSSLTEPEYHWVDQQLNLPSTIRSLVTFGSEKENCPKGQFCFGGGGRLSCARRRDGDLTMTFRPGRKTGSSGCRRSRDLISV